MEGDRRQPGPQPCLAREDDVVCPQGDMALSLIPYAEGGDVAWPQGGKGVQLGSDLQGGLGNLVMEPKFLDPGSTTRD